MKQRLDEVRFRNYLGQDENREMCDVCRACKNIKKIEEELPCGHLVCHGCLEKLTQFPNENVPIKESPLFMIFAIYPLVIAKTGIPKTFFQDSRN